MMAAARLNKPGRRSRSAEERLWHIATTPGDVARQ
jgi:hypothetical protein